MNENKIKILAISGSLRKSSTNTALLHATENLAPSHLDFKFYEGLGTLPHFNPELDGEDSIPPESVSDLRTRLKEADGILICTPEYGNGVPGVLKNALDWIVSSGEFMNKPVAVISASPTPMGGDKAHASLLLTLNMVNAKIVAEGMIIPFIRLKLNNEGEITDPALADELRSLLSALVISIHAQE
jgi:chromate reductase